MIITDEVLNQVYEGITFEPHERVPFFIVDADSYILIDDEEVNVIENYYTQTLDGVIYAKMNSTHNKNGTFSGAEPTYSAEVEAQWSELGTAISAESMMEIRKVAAMNAKDYREYMRDNLEYDSKPDSFEFECEFDGEVLKYNITDTDRIDVIAQLAMGATELEIHDVKRIKDVYTADEATVVMGTLAFVTRAYKYPYDAKIKALYQLPDGFTKGDVDDIVALG